MIKLIKSTFYNEPKIKKELISFIRGADFLSMGEECRKFEKNFSRKQGRKFSVLVNSGSSANLVLLQALLNLGRLKKGDKIGISALTWSTNVMPIIQLGMVPVALDCELATLNVSPKILEEQVSKLDGLFLTNALGFCDRIDEIKKICQKRKIVFIEDNCESVGSKTKGVLLGNFGQAATFSFFVSHHFSTIEGGMICTDDEKLYEMLVMTRAHGWDRNLEKERQRSLRKKYRVDDFLAKYVGYDLAYNVRPTEINGFLGNLAIKYWDEVVAKRESNFQRWQRVISKNNDLIALKMEHMDLVSNFAMPVVEKDRKTFKKYKDKFEKNDVEIRPVIAGDITHHPFYRKYVTCQSECRNASLVEKNGFYFGNDPQYSEKEIDFLSKLLEKN